jgi:hypothetical protein
MQFYVRTNNQAVNMAIHALPLAKSAQPVSTVYPTLLDGMPPPPAQKISTLKSASNEA